MWSEVQEASSLLRMGKTPKNLINTPQQLAALMFFHRRPYIRGQYQKWSNPDSGAADYHAKNEQGARRHRAHLKVYFFL
jgi:hypothetical protein